MPQKLTYKHLNVIFFLLFIQLVLLYVIKYSNQGLALSNFSLGNIGNTFNLSAVLLLVIGLIFVNRKAKISINKKTLNRYIAVSYLSIIMAYILTEISLPGNSVYLFSQPLDKLIVGLFFVLYQLIIFSFLAYVWFPIFSKTKNSLIKSLISGFSMLIIFLIVCFIFITTKGYGSGNWKLNRSENNLGFVLGAAVWSDNQPSPTLSARVDRAVQLLNDGFAGKIFLTGSNAPGELSEAAVALEYAVSIGVDSTKILFEKSTNSTNQQIYFLKENIYEKKTFNDIIIISDGYHLPRVVEICNFYNLDVKVAESNHKLDFKDKFYNNLRESIAIFAFWCFAL